MAAATLAQRGVHTLVVTADNTVNVANIIALDEAEFSIPVGRCRFIVVGKEAFDLLPERTQQFVFDPPQPDKSGYFGAVGRERVREPQKSAVEDTVDKLAEILNMMVLRSGDANRERMRAFGSGIGVF
jgi:hypothetical protein